MKKWMMVLGVMTSLCFACEEDQMDVLCGSKATFSDDFQTAPSAVYSIGGVELVDQCLAVEITSSGCSGLGWETQLLISPMVAESYPPQASGRLVLKNEEMCQAMITDTVFFDLSILDDISDKVILHLNGWDQEIFYNAFDAGKLVGSWELINYNGGLMGLNEDVDKGTVNLTFSSRQVEVINNGEGFFPIQSGTYNYRFESLGTEVILLINDHDLGILKLDGSQFTVDQRAADGFQYVFEK